MCKTARWFISLSIIREIDITTIQNLITKFVLILISTCFFHVVPGRLLTHSVLGKGSFWTDAYYQPKHVTVYRISQFSFQPRSKDVCFVLLRLCGLWSPKATAVNLAPAVAQQTWPGKGRAPDRIHTQSPGHTARSGYKMERCQLISGPWLSDVWWRCWCFAG